MRTLMPARIGFVVLMVLGAACALAADNDYVRRTDVVTGGGKPLTLFGHAIKVGEKAPPFTLPDGQSQPVSLSEFQGKVVILTSFPSVDTSVCATQTRTFNKK